MSKRATWSAVHLVAALVLAPVLLAAWTVTPNVDPRAGGARHANDPDGVGGIPFTGGPSDFGDFHSQLFTDGAVIDALGQPISGILVVITDASGVVATAVTNSSGAFCVLLPTEPELELALPSEGVVGIPVEAGEPILVIVR